MTALSMEITLATPDDFDAIARLIQATSRSPATHCLHAETAESVDDMVAEIRQLTNSGELIVAIARDHHLRAMIGCEYARELKRGWLRGPVQQDGVTEAQALYEALVSSLPEEITRLDTFLNAENADGDAFYRSKGYRPEGLTHVYETSRETAIFSDSMCRVLEEHQFEEFKRVHNHVFPSTYADGREIIEQLDPHKQVLVYVNHGEVLGYVRALVESEKEGYIEYLGVRSDARRQGIGRKLLHAALGYLIAERGNDIVSLCVSDGNTNARQLYENVGFALKHTGVNLRLIRTAEPT